MPGKSQIRAEVHFTPGQMDEFQLKDKNVVVIDVLRASTTISTALRNGAREIIPVGDIESAVKISGSLFGDVTLRGGERNGRIIEGFNLGNSPLEYTPQTVKGKSIIFMTTNGTAAMVKGRYAKNLIVGSFVNLSGVAAFLGELGEDFAIVCAGKENRYCIEDAVCAGAILHRLSAESGAQIALDDGGTSAAALHKSFGKNILKMLKQSEHGKYLSGIGFGKDLDVCAKTDSVPVVPFLTGSVIRVRKESVKAAAKAAT